MNYGKKGTSNKDKSLTSKSHKVRKKFSIIFLKTMLICLIGFVVVGACAGFGILKGVIDSAPEITPTDVSPTGFSTSIYNSEGQEITKLVASGANRIYVTIDEIPQCVQEAFVAIEDERFYEHNGIDIQGIARAGVTGITNGFNFSEGASTITQQLLKNTIFTNWTSENSFAEKLERKIQEQYLAVEITKLMEKDLILEKYLNTINLGQNTLGVQSASKRYFNKDVKDLTISESAVIAAITQNPTRYNPVSNPEKNATRREKTLSHMKKQGYISETEFQEAINDDVYARIQSVNNEMETSSVYSYFVDELTEQVVNDLVEQKGYTQTQATAALYSSGLGVYTTLNPAIQQIADEEFANLDNYPDGTQLTFTYRLTIQKADETTENYSEQTMSLYTKEKYGDQSKEGFLIYNSEEEAIAAIEEYKATILLEGDEIVPNGEIIQFTPQPQASVTIIDQYTGNVVAIVGGRGPKEASLTLNRATNTVRQPGSTFKILAAFAPALDTAGMTLATVQDDAPYSYENGRPLKNYDKNYRGLTTIRFAITKSINVVTVKTLTDITTQLGYDYLLNFGFTTLVSKDIVQSLGLGGITNGVTNLELTAAYAAIANGGTYTKPKFYSKIIDHDGNILIDNTSQTRTVLKDTTAFLLTSAMQDVITSGTGGAVNFGSMPIAGKTGTTSNNKDVWFSGYTPYYTCSVWGGYDTNMNLKNTSYPKTLWRSIMSRVHENLEHKSFSVPEDIVQSTVCSKSGKLSVEGLCDLDPRGSMIISEYFARGTIPSEVCDHHISATICNDSQALAGEYCPEASKATSTYIIGGSDNSGDAPYLYTEALATSTCTLHSAASFLDSLIPEPPVITPPTQETTPEGETTTPVVPPATTPITPPITPPATPPVTP